MLDFFNLPQSQNADIQTFGPGQSTWNKPRGKSMAYILCIGAGGGGGGSGGQSTSIIPLTLLPDFLNVYVGIGSEGGSAVPGGPTVVYVPTSNGAIITGSSSTTSLTISNTISGNVYIGQTVYNALTAATTITAGFTSPYTISASQSIVAGTTMVTLPAAQVLICANGGSAGGNNANNNTAGIAGTGAAAATIAMTLLSGQGFANFYAGQNGVAGGSTALTLPTTGLILTGGTGGGSLGANNATGASGGAITGAGFVPTNPGGIGGSAGNNPGSIGSNGFTTLNKLWYSVGGTGGGAAGLGTPTGNTAAIGAFGGAGGIGCGGGGGGGGYLSTPQSFGGKGGDGICIIISW